MKSALKLLLTTCFFLSFYKVHSQEDLWRRNLPQIISPQAYEFTKYGDVPVNTYTGVPNISVPLYEIEAAGLNIPISLSYHSNGIKVSEEASWVGLGWTLNAGGSIVQVVKGFDDFNSVGAFGYPHPSNFNIPGGVSDCQSKIIRLDTNDEGIDASALRGTVDSEPDIFVFNALGYSIEFLFDKEQDEFICLTDKNIKIKSDLHSSGMNYPQIFNVTVPDGHVFYFQLMDRTNIDQYYSQKAGGAPSPSLIDLKDHAASRLYQLILIYTNKGEEIKFVYEQTDPITNYPSMSITNIRNEFNQYSNPGPRVHELFPFKQTAYSFYATSQSYSYLRYIESDKAFIEFSSSDNRLDLNGAKRLDRMTVKNNANNRGIIKSFSFNYDYFKGHLNGTNYDPYLLNINIHKAENEKKLRLKLLSIEEKADFASGAISPYRFEYSNVQPPIVLVCNED